MAKLEKIAFKFRARSAAAIAAAVLAGTGTTATHAATRYFDVLAGAGNGVGGSGTLANNTTADFSTTVNGDMNLTTAAATDDVVFTGTAGTVTLSGNYNVSTATFNTSNYTLTTSNSTARTFNASGAAGIVVRNNANLNLSSSGGSSQLTLSNVSGGMSSTLTITGATTAATDVVEISLFSGDSIAATAPVTIATTGNFGGISGFASKAGTETINASITNNTITGTNTLGVLTMLGASSGNTLTVNGLVTGSGGVQFSSGTSGGAGTINLNNTNNYTGPTQFNGTASGSVKLLVDNALSTTSAVTMGYSTGNGQALDLDGHNQTFASLASGTGGTGSIIDSASSSSGPNTLTINGSATTSFGLNIGNTSTGAKVALALASTNTGVLTLTGNNNYSAGTTVNGGTLTVNTGGTIGAATGALAVNSSTGTSVLNLNVNQTVASLTGTVTGGSATINLGTSDTLTVNQASTTSYAGAIAGNGALTKNGSAGSLTLSGTNTYAGITTINAGTLQFAQEASLYNDNTSNWTATNIVVGSGATAAFNVGGPGEFTVSDITTLSALGTSSGGFESGSILGLDTTNAAGGNFTYNGNIVNPNTGSNVLGLTKLGTNTLTAFRCQYILGYDHCRQWNINL